MASVVANTINTTEQAQSFLYSLKAHRDNKRSAEAKLSTITRRKARQNKYGAGR